MGKTRCINCMQPIEETIAFCPYCGYGQRTEASPFGIKPGTILRGRYLTGRMLGQGGFGITYVGYDLTLEIKVAIKEYYPSGSVTRNSTVSNQVQWNAAQMNREQWQAGCESFLKEARRIAKIDSLPGIVRVRDTFPENQTAYIVMDYIEGETLKQRLMKTGPMKYTECLRMLRPLIESLGKMHRQGLVHRDISPDNIMVQPDGSVCLLDFGAAKDVSSQQNAASQQIAKKGFSPLEQYREKGSIGSWTDVYALCATIYYCITGKLVPDALDRMYEDSLSFDMFLSEPLEAAAVNTLRDGLKLRSEERIQTVEELLGRFDGMPENGQKTDSGSTMRNDPGTSVSDFASQPYAEASPQNNLNSPYHAGNSYYGQEKPLKVQGKKKRSRKKTIGIAAAVVIGLFALVGIFSGSDEKETGKQASSGQINPETSADTETQSAEDTGMEAGTTGLLSDTGTENAGKLNLLMKENLCKYDDSDNKYHGTVLGSEIDRESITSITFVDTLEGVPEHAWDVSWDQNGTVMAWTEPNPVQDTGLDLMIGAEGKITAQDCEGLFQGFYNVESIEFNDCFDTSQAADMRVMFCDCESLEQLDVSSLDTSRATDMSGVFAGCRSLQQLDLSGFQTDHVTDMSVMFSGCYSLEQLDVSSFETGQVTDMRCMFMNCESLAQLDLNNFDTSRVEDMSYMFAGCVKLERLDLSNFDTSRVENISFMFRGCESLTQLDISGFDTSHADNFSMFDGCAITAEEAWDGAGKTASDGEMTLEEYCSDPDIRASLESLYVDMSDENMTVGVEIDGNTMAIIIKIENESYMADDLGEALQASLLENGDTFSSQAAKLDEAIGRSGACTVVLRYLAPDGSVLAEQAFGAQ